MKRIMLVAIGGLVAAGALAGCAPTGSPSPTTPTTTSASPTASPTATPVTVEVFFITNTATDIKLVSELHELELLPTNQATQVLAKLISGELQPLDPDYESLWQSPNQLLDLSTTDGQAAINLSPVQLSVGAAGEVAAINQLVWSLTAIDPSISSVSFLINGEPADSFAGHVDIMTDFKRQPAFEVLNAIQIDSLLEGAELSGPVTISGQACTFEANIRWTLTRGDEIVNQGSALAAEACPTRSPWAVALGELPAGEYVFSAQEFSPSDGTLAAEDTKSFIVK